MQNNTQTFDTIVNGKKLTMEVGRLAGQANGAVRAQLGDTVLLATAVMAAKPREGASYFPLGIEFDEKLYAAGRIKGSRWVKREGRPSDEAILTARLIDRTLRPLFSPYMRNEVQIIVSVLSFDGENDPDMLGIVACSAALAISDIPWEGPISAVRASRNSDGKVIINPTYSEREESDLEIVVSGPEGVVNMLEGGANENSEEDLMEAVRATEDARNNLAALQKEMVKKIGTEKTEVPLFEADEEVKNDLTGIIGDALEKALFISDQTARSEKLDELKRESIVKLIEKHPTRDTVEAEGELLFEQMTKKVTQESILEKKRRVDGRALGELRTLSAEVSTLPRTHGSAVFNRGATQALSIVTLGAPGLEQSIETMEEVGTRRFMHHYNFPPFSVGETGRMFTGRREIGHGSLAERALLPVIPKKEVFPYVIRIVTEILSSNGSTSMASVCGSSLALMDAGVPLSAAVAGISVGLVSDTSKNPGERYELLTDIQGVEDFYGHMDFKVAGTEKGVTAIQVDMKVRGITHDMIEASFARAREARGTILATMNSTLASSRKELSQYAPRVLTITINPEKIGNVIGPGGKIINRITDETGAAIDIEDDGMIFITSPDQEGAEKARKWVEDITREPKPDEVFIGPVVRLLNFGAFVEILPQKDGLVHVSELTDDYVEKVEDVVKVGDTVRVKVKEIDSEGRVNLTMKGVSQDDLDTKNKKEA